MAASPADVPAVQPQPRRWPRCRCRRRAGGLPSRAGAAGNPPSVHTVLAGAEIFHLPQFLLIKRMNCVSVARSGNLSPPPLVLSAPRGALLRRKERARSFMRPLSNEGWWLPVPGGWSRSALGGALALGLSAEHGLSPGPRCRSCSHPWSDSADV